MARIHGERLRVLGLTSSPVSDASLLHHHFSALVMRIRRKYGCFEYIGVREFTKSGLLHSHLIYRGVFIPQRWLSRVWEELHGAFRVYVQEMRGSRRKIGAYLVKYLGKEADSGRYWWSWGWVYRGFVRDWKLLVRKFKSSAVAVWRRLLWGDTIHVGPNVLIVPWIRQLSLVGEM